MPGSQNCPPNFHRKSPRNVLRVFDVCSEMQSDCTQYFGFAVEEFAGITGVSELFDCWAFCLLETVTSGSRKNRERGDVRRICPPQIQNNFYSRVVFQTSIKYSQNISTTLSVGIRSRLFKKLDTMFVFTIQWRKEISWYQISQCSERHNFHSTGCFYCLN